jgi:hypothetical protein
MPYGKKGLRQRLVLGTGGSIPKAGDDAHGIDRQEQMKPFLPPEPVTPADIHHTWQPTQTAPLGIAGRNCRGI